MKTIKKKHENFKQYLNKGISTPIGILAVLLVAVAASVLIWQFLPEEEIPSPPPVASPTPTTTPSPLPSPAPTTPEPYINIISPNGGEELEEGRTHTIEWESDGVDKVNISYTGLPGDFGVNYIVQNILAPLGSYEWNVNVADTVGSGTEFPGEYKIQVSSADDGVFVNDESDNYFSIIANDETAENLKDIAINLYSKHLESYQSNDTPLRSRLKKYIINSITIGIVEDECFRFVVNFSVETFKEENDGWTDWVAGNGEESGIWVNNKQMVIDVLKENNSYKIREMGTGMAASSCMGN